MQRAAGTTASAPRRTPLVGGRPLAPGLRWPHARHWVAMLSVLLVAAGVRTELRTSRLQATLASALADTVGFEVLGGKNPVPLPAASGPYDERLGYTQIGEHVARLEAAGFRVEAQARPSARAEALAALGVPAVFAEKSRAGLSIEDRNGLPLSETLEPRRAVEASEAVPRTVVDTLLFIENRDLLGRGYRYRNPVIEWPRLARAALLQVLPRAGARRPGGSTLAVQIEKYRHSPGGMTATLSEKLRQITAATLRSYLDGPDSTAARRRIVRDYLSTVPMAARAGFGEVQGIPDGLSAWFGVSWEETMRALQDGPLEARALAYRRLLSLFLAQRRPSHYLRAGREDLRVLADGYLRRLAEAGVIAPALRDAALAVRPGFLDPAPPRPRADFVAQKPVASVRNELVSWLDLPGTYDLDRLDAEVDTSLDAEAQERVTGVLQALRDPAGLGAWLRRPRLLEHGDPGGVVYSFLLYERVGHANLLRVQADTLDQPFDVNEGMKLDLGSTAKLRTLVHYLQLVAGVYDRQTGKTRAELAAVAVHPRDRLTRFVVDALRARPDLTLAGLVDAALERRYSARPARFYTGGGSQPIGNYEAAFDDTRPTLRIALRHSVNLPFVRLMSEIVDHLSFRPGGPGGGVLDDPGGPGGGVLDDPGDPQRDVLLSRFAERESLTFLSSFAARYQGRTALGREALLARRAQPTPWRLAVVYRWLHPTGDVAALHRFLTRQLPGERFDGDALRRWYEQAGPRLSLADRGWLVGLHPIELWLVRYWDRHPGAGAGELRRASAAIREDAYTWLFRAPRRAQDLRIRTELERDAFREIHAAWARTGYPFASLVPSLATAIGSSADRPAALAELMGILQNDGLRLPSRRIERIRLASETPYETRLEARDARPERVLRPEVARAVRTALLDVVANGTARRARGALRAADGSPLPLGGKTGTGDDRRKRFAADGRLLASEVASRSATLAFLAGDRYFGVLTAYVEGAQAEAYHFTSSLPAQVLRYLGPALEPLLGDPPPQGMQALRPSPPSAPSSRARVAVAPGEEQGTRQAGPWM